MQRQLLRDLDFEKAYTTSLAIEAALRDMHTCSTLQQQQQGASSSKDEEAVVQKFQHTHFKGKQVDKGQPCFRCGRRDHVADVCRFKTARCHHCGKLGHTVRARQSTPENNQPQTLAVQNLVQVSLLYQPSQVAQNTRCFPWRTM